MYKPYFVHGSKIIHRGKDTSLTISKPLIFFHMWGKGCVVEARDRVGQWLVATVLTEEGEGEAYRARVHFKGWSSRADEWVQQQNIRERIHHDQPPVQDEVTVATYDGGEDGHIEDDAWEVERIMRKRERDDGMWYLIKWAGNRWSKHKQARVQLVHLHAHL